MSEENLSPPTTEEIERLKQERLKLSRQISSKRETITELDNSIQNKSTQRDSLNADIENLITQRDTIQSTITETTPIKNQLETDLAELQLTHTEVTEQVKALNQNKTTLEGKIGFLQTKKEELESNVQVWTEKNDLYTNDITGISTDNKSQRNKYIFSAIVSFILAAILMCHVICAVRDDISIPSAIKEIFDGSPGYSFYLIILGRVSVIAALFVLIFIFINLTRGFVSQFIRTQEKMSAIRLINFLVTQVGKDAPALAEAEKLNYETQRIAKQNELLNKHLPDLIEYNPSSFDKLTKTKGLEDRLETLLKKQTGEDE